jgi:hypothetical protein
MYTHPSIAACICKHLSPVVAALFSSKSVDEGIPIRKPTLKHTTEACGPYVDEVDGDEEVSFASCLRSSVIERSD